MKIMPWDAGGILVAIGQAVSTNIDDLYEENIFK